MRKIFSTIVLASVFLAAVNVFAGPEKLRRPVGFVSDTAGIISSDVERSLNNLLTEAERKSSAEIAVVTVKSLDGLNIDDYANRLFELWGIGKKGKDNGVLFLVAVNDRKMRIEVGYGLEGALTDGTAGQIRDQFVLPAFKTGQYSKGIMDGTYGILGVVGREYNVDLLSYGGVSAQRYVVQKRSPAGELLRFLFFLIFVILFGGRGFFFPFLFGTYFGRSRYWSGGGYYRGGSSFSSGFGGGFSGFGGGMSGGGGASGGW